MLCELYAYTRTRRTNAKALAYAVVHVQVHA